MARTLVFQCLVDLLSLVMESSRKGMFPTNFCQDDKHRSLMGSFLLTAVETSAAGKVVVARDECRFAPVTNIRFDVVGGKMQNFTAGGWKSML